jgi:hypothetical protein
VEETFGSSGKKLNLFNKVIYLLTQPEEFFKATRKENFSSSFIYLLFITAIPTAIKLALFFFGITLPGSDSIALILGGYAGVIIITFVLAGIFHIFAKLFGGSSGYVETYKAYVYGFTPSILFSWIPYIGILGLIYGVYIFIKGISLLHGLPSGKAFLVWFIPVLILGIILLILIIILGVAILSFLSGAYSQNPEFLNYLDETGEFIKVLK